MNGHTRSKSRLLARASTVAILAAAGQFGVVAQAQAACSNIGAPTTINSDIECAEVIGATVAGDVTNEARIGEPVDEDNAAAFFVGGEGSITGALINNETITGGDAFYGALTIGDGGSILGGIVNNGQIISGSGNAISIGYYTFEGVRSGTLGGGITNSGGINGAIFGIVAVEGSMSGGLLNNSNAVISGGEVGIFIDDRFDSWTDGIVNNGNVIGDEAGIQIGSLVGTGAGDVTFSGGIQNSGTISSLSGPSVIAGGNSFNDGITNSGLITQRSTIAAGGENAYAGIGVVISAETFTGGIYNSGIIEGLGGPAVWVTSENTSFDGDILNDGTLSGRLGILITSETFSSNITNTGTGLIEGLGIDGVGGRAIEITSDYFFGDVTNYGTIIGDFTNNGPIVGSSLFDGGVLIDGETFTGNFVNHGLISQFYVRDEGTPAEEIEGDAVRIVSSMAGNFTNTGTIEGGEAGVWIDPLEGLNPEGAFTGNFSNSGLISGQAGPGVTIETYAHSGLINNSGSIMGGREGLNVETTTFVGGIANEATGHIQGNTGVYVSAHTFDGDIANSGLIQGDENGAEVYVIAAFSSECECFVSGTFDGNITNSGVIRGIGNVGLEIESGFIETGGAFTGTITNASSGTISGGFVGAVIELGGNYTGDFINDGLITGGYRGLDVSVDDFIGDFTNNGTIYGGSDGAVIFANDIVGDITNNGSIIGEDVDTALHVVAGTMLGNVVNTNYLSAGSNALHVDIGTLTGQVINSGYIQSTFGGTAVLLNIGNGTTFQNTGGGFIEGDVEFNGAASTSAYVFSAGNGSIEGSLIGFGTGGVNNDTIVVNGAHSFTGGSAQNFLSFTVTGGTAIMGANSVGGPSASPYAFSNVDTLSVTGGTLYIDQGTTLNVDQSYTQGANGTLMFDLGAPGGSGFSSLTGTQIAGPGDYGQIIVAGPVTLNGTIAGWLDPAFASANPALEEVIYNDVITSTSPITTDFTTTALVANNSLFQLFDLIDGNTVDLRVARSPLGQFPSVSVIVGTNDPFDANIADRTNGIGSGGCGLAGGGWCFNRYAANEPGATSVMTDASPGEDPFAWLRTGVRRVGETAVWGRGVGVWGDTDGDAAVGIPGSDFSLAGGIVGADHVFTTTLLAGLAAQWTTTDVEFDGRRDNADVSSIEIGAYGSWGDTRLYLNTNVSYIWHDFEVRRFDGPDFANGDYDGNTLSAYAEAGKIFETESGFRIQPILALSYAQLDTDAYSEVGTAATLLDVFDADYTSLKGMVGGRFAYPFALGSGRKWVPEARLMWSHEFMDDQASHFVDVQGGPVIKTLVNGEEFSRDSLIAGAGVTAPVSDDATMFVDYDATLNEDVTIHTVSAGARLRW